MFIYNQKTIFEFYLLAEYLVRSNKIKIFDLHCNPRYHCFQASALRCHQREIKTVSINVRHFNPEKILSINSHIDFQTKIPNILNLN